MEATKRSFRAQKRSANCFTLTAQRMTPVRAMRCLASGAGAVPRSGRDWVVRWCKTWRCSVMFCLSSHLFVFCLWLALSHQPLMSFRSIQMMTAMVRLMPTTMAASRRMRWRTCRLPSAQLWQPTVREAGQQETASAASSWVCNRGVQPEDREETLQRCRWYREPEGRNENVSVVACSFVLSSYGALQHTHPHPHPHPPPLSPSLQVEPVVVTSGTVWNRSSASPPSLTSPSSSDW